MTRFFSLAALFTLLSAAATAQDNLNGKWYMFSRNRLIRFDFSDHQLVTDQLNWSLEARERSERDTQVIVSRIEANGNIYLSLQQVRDTTKQLRINTMQVTEPGKKLLLVLNAADTLFTDTVWVHQYVMSDTGKKYGFTLFSEKEIQRLKRQPDVSEMTVQDFKNYADRIREAGNEMDSLSKLPATPNGLLYYGYAMTRILLGELGYNPLVTTMDYEKFIKHFQDIEETKPVVDKLFH